MVTRRDLVCVLIGIALSVLAFGYRASVQRQEQLELRVQHIEGYLVSMSQALAGR